MHFFKPIRILNLGSKQLSPKSRVGTCGHRIDTVCSYLGKKQYTLVKSQVMRVDNLVKGRCELTRQHENLIATKFGRQEALYPPMPPDRKFVAILKSTYCGTEVLWEWQSCRSGRKFCLDSSSLSA